MLPHNILRKIYNKTLRPYLPVKYRLLAGVAVPDTPLLDFTADKKFYKKGLMDAIVDGVNRNDKVELIGFGRGVSTVWVFDQGASHVTAYEAAEEMINLGKETVTTNRPFDCDLLIEQSIVGDPKEIYGDASAADIKDPADLCDSDVLILDCEGSEKSILEDLGEFPNTIICETHPEYSVTNESIIEIIRKAGYKIKIYDYEPKTYEKKVVLGRR